MKVVFGLLNSIKFRISMGYRIKIKMFKICFENKVGEFCIPSKTTIMV